MSRFKIDAPDGRRITIEGDAEPTDEEVEEILSSLPEKVDRVSILADKKAPKPKEDFEPSAMRSFTAAIKSLTKKLDDISRPDTKPPVVNVAQPKISVEAPNVNVDIKQFKRWKIKVTERDEYGRIADLTITAVE